MTGYLLDTSALSQFVPGRSSPDPELAGRLRAATDRLFLPTIAVSEIVEGIEKLRRRGADRRADTIALWLDRLLGLYGQRVLSFDIASARAAGVLADAAIGRGRHPGFADVAIAGIARAHDLTIVTENMRHFVPLGVRVCPLADIA